MLPFLHWVHHFFLEPRDQCLWLLDLLSTVFGSQAQQVVSYLVPSGHYYNFIDGIVDTRDLVYYVSATFVFLFLASRVLDSRRWQE